MGNAGYPVRRPLEAGEGPGWKLVLIKAGVDTSGLSGPPATPFIRVTHSIDVSEAITSLLCLPE